MIKTQKLYKTQRFSDRGKKVAKFLRRTYQMLQDARYSEYISWSSDGKSILIKKPFDLAEDVFPHFFKHQNFQSFIRQKDKRISDEQIYSHPCFVRDKPELLANIRRKCGKKEPEQLEQPQEPSEPVKRDLDLERIEKQNMELKALEARLNMQLEGYRQQLNAIDRENELILLECEKKEREKMALNRLMNQLSAPTYPLGGSQVPQRPPHNNFGQPHTLANIKPEYTGNPGEPLHYPQPNWSSQPIIQRQGVPRTGWNNNHQFSAHRGQATPILPGMQQISWSGPQQMQSFNYHPISSQISRTTQASYSEATDYYKPEPRPAE